MQFDVSSSVSVSLEVTYFFIYRSERDNGQSDYDEWVNTFPANSKFVKSYSDDDGYGNSESLSSTLQQFVMKVNSTIIYSGSEIPADGSIFNGYQIHRNSINN